jgi:hypothetical protein
LSTEWHREKGVSLDIAPTLTLSDRLHLEAALISPSFVSIEVFEFAEGEGYVNVVCPFDDPPVF